MFTLPHNTIAYLYKEAIDMRLGMFRLQGVIAEQLSQPMVRGSFFLFINKPHTLLKAVWFDGTGLCLFCKRLEQGQFSWPQAAAITEGKVEGCDRLRPHKTAASEQLAAESISAYR
ncbi:MAG: IS66 family insertion sequence element accessory protein TnpB [Akkermansiaceae bacterium]|nr:IS66 family insertion sequence element accessory protein TnpB [Akkermansiaceae bacterium]